MKRFYLIAFAGFIFSLGTAYLPARAAVELDRASVAAVWSSAISYIAPRALQPLSYQQMTMWGLNGLAALDPNLSTQLRDQQIRLYGPDRLLIALPEPGPMDASGWGDACAKVAEAAFAVSSALQRAGTQGLISSLFDELFNHFDPYSRYEPPLMAARDQLMITGIAGTGMVLDAEHGTVVVQSVAIDSPAQAQGITAGSIILSIDGHNVRPSEINSLNAQMNGIAGTSMAVSVVTPLNAPAAEDLTLTRVVIPPQTVISQASPAPNIMVLQITGFNHGTDDEFSSALAQAFSADVVPTGLIIDLRGDRGGVLRQAALVADSLLPSGAIAIATGRDPAADQSFIAEGADLTHGAPVVVLVDGQTASAAEIFAAALADNGRAVVVGSATLGKGLVQTITSLPDGGELYVTWARVLAPRGWPLQTLGVLPQFCTSLGDPAVQEQVAGLLKHRNLMAGVIKETRAMKPDADVNSILAVRDQCPADTGSDFDVNVAAFLINNPNAYRAALVH